MTTPGREPTFATTKMMLFEGLLLADSYLSSFYYAKAAARQGRRACSDSLGVILDRRLEHTWPQYSDRAKAEDLFGHLQESRIGCHEISAVLRCLEQMHINGNMRQ
jgi:hypothetical protein